MIHSSSPLLRYLLRVGVYLLPLPAVFWGPEISWSHRLLTVGLAWFAIHLVRCSFSWRKRTYRGIIGVLAVAVLVGCAFWEIHRASVEDPLVENGLTNQQAQRPEILSSIGSLVHDPTILWGIGFAVVLLFTYGLSRWLAPQGDDLLFISASVLIGLGLAVLYRLGPAEAALRQQPAFQTLALRQAVWIGFGFVIYLSILYFVTERVLLQISRWKYIYIWLAVALILITALWGRKINGRRLWLGIGPFTFQSIELVKLLILFFIASYFSERRFIPIRHLGRLHVPRLKTVGPYLLVWGLALAPVFLQGDLGPTFLLFTVFLCMFYVGSPVRTPLVAGILLTCMMGVVCYAWGKPTIVRTRVDMWLQPFSHCESMTQAFWSFSAGGWFGTGLGKGMPEQIPVVHSDFNIAAIAEELGLFGSLSVLLIYLAFFTRGYIIAIRSNDRFHTMLATGILVLLGMQTLIILGGVTQLLPLTGITMPFISYGGSSMLVNFIMLGILTKLSEGCDNHTIWPH